MRASSDDLPAFGKPTSAASASSFRCSSMSRSSPGGPTSAKRGTCRVDETKRAFPRPPWPPRARTTLAAACARSATRCPSSSNTCVPTGTPITASSPSAPCLRAPRPFSPRPALIQRRRCSAERSRSDGSARSTTSPPLPPSPPSGPPFGTNFSRRKLRPPSPPLPACTWMRARSLNMPERYPDLYDGNSTPSAISNRTMSKPKFSKFRTSCVRTRSPKTLARLAEIARSRRGSGRASSLRLRLDDRHGAPLAARPERDRPGTDREDRVVAADLRPRTGAELRPPLPDDDAARLRLLAVEHLHAEVLRVGVAAVLGRAQTLLVRHVLRLLFRLERGFERLDRALARRVRALVVERRLEHRAVPRLRAVGDLRDRHLLVPRRHSLDVLAGGGRLELRLRRRGRTGRGRRGLLRLAPLLRAERDAHARRRRPEPVVAPVARSPLVLADPDLRATAVRDDGCRHGDAVAAEEHIRRERLARFCRQPVHGDRLALANAVLLAAQTDDRVVHKRGKSAARAAERRQV